MQDHMLRVLEIKPDSQRSYYDPSSEATMTLNAHEVDYIDLSASALYVRVSFFDPHNFAGGSHPLKTLALGAASLIRRFENFCGTQQLEQIEHFNIHVGSEMEGYLTAKQHNEFTGFNCDLDDKPYRHGLHEKDSRSPHGEDNWSKSIWLKIPLATAFNDAGFIPVYQTSNKIKFRFKFADQHEPWAYGSPFPVSIYGQSKNSANAEFYGGGGYACMADEGSETRFVTDYEAEGNGGDWSFRIDDITLIAHGLTVLNEGMLDATPFEIWTTSVTCLTQPCTGAKHERKVFQIKKSSIEKVKWLMIPPEAIGRQGIRDPDIGQWFRASPYTFNQAKYNNEDAHENRYLPWIIWWKVSMGGVSFPLPFGAGREAVDDLDENTYLWHHEYLKYFGRNTDTSDVSRSMLAPHSEDNHGLLRDNLFRMELSHNNGGRPKADDTGAVPTFYKYNVKTTTDAYERVGKTSHVLFNPTWFSNAASLYSADIKRYGVVGTMHSDGDAHNAHGFVDIFAPGGKAIFACTFNPVDKAPNLIQGVDTEMFDINIEWKRRDAVDTENQYEFGADPGTWKHPGSSQFGTNKDIIPDIYAFFTYDIRLTIHNGIITIDD